MAEGRNVDTVDSKFGGGVSSLSSRARSKCYARCIHRSEVYLESSLFNCTETGLMQRTEQVPRGNFQVGRQVEPRTTEQLGNADVFRMCR